MDTKRIYTGKAQIVNRGNGIVLRCMTTRELSALLEQLKAFCPAGGRMKDIFGRVTA